MTLLLSFDHDHRANHLGRRSYVQIEELAVRRWCENGSMSERRLQPFEGFLGFIVSQRGIEPNPDKVSAITRMGPIRDLKGVQRVMG